MDCSSLWTEGRARERFLASLVVRRLSADMIEQVLPIVVFETCRARGGSFGVRHGWPFQGLKGKIREPRAAWKSQRALL